MVIITDFRDEDSKTKSFIIDDSCCLFIFTNNIVLNIAEYSYVRKNKLL